MTIAIQNQISESIDGTKLGEYESNYFGEDQGDHNDITYNDTMCKTNIVSPSNDYANS